MRSFIASRHGSFVADRLARLSEQYLNAYDNVANWDIGINGELRAIRDVLTRIEGDVLDVGANAGQWATAVIPYLGDRSLHSFEVVPPIYVALARNVAGHANVFPVNKGLSDATGTIEVHYSPSSSTISSAYPLIEDRQDQVVVTCAVMRGDDYIQDTGIGDVALLKIDVEGMEIAVLDGFEASFRRGAIKTVQFEHGPSHLLSGHTMQTFVQWFDRFGYDVYTVYPNRLIPFSFDIMKEKFTGQNFYAIRRDMCNNFGR